MKWLDPNSIRPPHGETCRLRSIVLSKRFLDVGWKNRPLVVIKLRNSKRWKYYSITGSHRIAAARSVGIKVPAIILPSSFYDQIKREGLVWIDGYTLLYCSLYDDASFFIQGTESVLDWSKHKDAAKVLSKENSETREWIFKDLGRMVLGIKKQDGDYKMILSGRRFIIVDVYTFRRILPFIKKNVARK